MTARTSQSGFWITAVAGVVILGGVYWMTHRTQSAVEQDQAHLTQTNQLLQNKVTQLENDLTALKGASQQQGEKINAIPEAIYHIEPIAGNDLRITRTTITAGTDAVVVASVKTAAGFTNRTDGVELFASFPKDHTIALRRYRTGAGADEALQFDYWKYDTDAGTFQEYTDINVLDKDHLNVEVIPSPSKKLVAFVHLDEERNNTGSSRHISILDILSGAFKSPAITIDEGQTLNALYSYPSIQSTIVWKSENILSFSTYDQTHADTKNRTEKPLVKSTQVELK